MKKFVANLKISGITSSEIDLMLSQGVKHMYKKGEIFSEGNKNWDKLGILHTGLLGGWYIDENAEKRYREFYYLPSNDFVIDYENYISETKSNLTIEALDDCEILVFQKETVLQIKQDYPKLAVVEKFMAREKYLMSQKLLAMFQTCNAVQRIKLLQKYAPEILSKVPYTHIASFLGLHRNSFSEALKRM